MIRSKLSYVHNKGSLNLMYFYYYFVLFKTLLISYMSNVTCKRFEKYLYLICLNPIKYFFFIKILLRIILNLLWSFSLPRNT